jgi:Ala-tRNA(Pro) deacylase
MRLGCGFPAGRLRARTDSGAAARADPPGDPQISREGVMLATQHAIVPGDVVEVNVRRVGEAVRLGEILEVLGPSEHPHYAVRWEDGHTSLLYPGADSQIRRHPPVAPGPHRELAPATRLLVDRLAREGVDFEVLLHSRSTTAAAEARALGVLPQTVAKTVIAKGADELHVRAVLPATSRVSMSKLAQAATAPSVRLLTEAELVADYPQFELGAVPPFGGPGGDRVIVDRSLMEHAHVVFEGGVHDTSLRLRVADLIDVADAQRADIVGG